MSEAPANLVRRIVAAPHRVPEPLRNQAWRAVQAEGLMLFDFAVSRPELKADLDAAFIRLQDKSYNPPTPRRPSEAARARAAIYARRLLFDAVSKAALALYLQRIPDPLPAFRRKPKNVRVAFKRQCIMDYFRRTHGDPFYREP